MIYFKKRESPRGASGSKGTSKGSQGIKGDIRGVPGGQGGRSRLGGRRGSKGHKGCPRGSKCRLGGAMDVAEDQEGDLSGPRGSRGTSRASQRVIGVVYVVPR